MVLPDIDLPKLAGVAGSAVGLIIATAILLSWVTARYVPTFDRYRSLTGELRGYKDQTRRRGALREQIQGCHGRLILMSRASCMLCWVMMCAIATIASASLAITLPPRDQLSDWQTIVQKLLSLVGAGALAIALVLDAVAVSLVIRENQLDRSAIESELSDLDEVGETPGDGGQRSGG